MGKILEILGNIGFDWRVALANLFNFLIIFYLVNKFLFPSIKRALNSRKQKIEEGLMNAEKAKTSLIMAEEEKKQVIAKAEAEAFELKAKAEKDRTGLISKAHEEAILEGRKVVAEHHAKLDIMTRDAERDIEKKAVDMVVASVEKMLQVKMTVATEKEYIKNVTKNV